MEEKDENLIKEPQGRKLTKAESIRIKQVALTAADLEEKGYKLHNLTVSTVKANVLGIVAGCVLALPFVLAFHFTTGLNNHIIKPVYLILCPLAMIVSIVVHELIHGISWSIFTPNHFKDIAFGIMMPYLSPYCTCMAPLTKPRHIFGTVMPLILLGIIPTVIGIAAGIPMALLMGLLMIDIATGDILIIRKILAYKTSAKDVVYMDHPTDAGGVIFER